MKSQNLRSEEFDAVAVSSQYSKHFRAFAIFGLTLLLCGCASNSGVIHHGFSFGSNGADTGVEVLDYQYGENVGLPTRASKFELERGRVTQWNLVAGPMPVAEFLYVKWRDIKVRTIHERRVNLKAILPHDLKGKYVHFGFEQKELHIYVVNRNIQIKPGAPKCPAISYEQFQCLTIFPVRRANF